MGQLGFFDADKWLAAISAKGDPLEMIDRVVPFESFRAEIEAAVLTPADAKKSNAGRKRIDVIVMFRMLVLQSLYNFSDEQAEYHVHDRMSFTRFLRLGFEDRIPDATTLWLFRETLAKAGLIERLFERFGHHLEAKGYIARGGQMVDATIVPVPKQRNSRRGRINPFLPSGWARCTPLPEAPDEGETGSRDFPSAYSVPIRHN
jgi:IS5 family transposase